MTVQRFLCHSTLFTLMASAAYAQTGAAPKATGSAAAPRSAFALPVAPVSEATPAPGHSLLEQPAQPARVTLESGRLSVAATNASLTQTLREISTATGTQIDGLSKDQRVFGIYGPGSPQEVLTALLDDSGYNVLMVGRLAGGAPRQLVLSARSAGTAVAAATTTARPASDDDDDEAPATPPTPEPPAAVPAAAAPGTPAQPGQVKTPQQMLEELQQLHKGQDAPALPRDQPQ